ncbi:GTPase IMAP family member 6 [Anabarilius grahami]|uniref:GTPase IMAP family member 6 n=1 Tax=Anabarilius grahami TaxID=495550 RepID=A0A3N0XIV1_ANAGA|nr:GTPase IMAP family member 6 [Anabarilius grahami]
MSNRKARPLLSLHFVAVVRARRRNCASHDDDVRILIVGIRGDSRFSAADILSGRKDGGQEDREIVKTPVITDEGRRMTLVTGPNLCEEDTARQSFTTALFLSSPGPHAVLMVLNLEDEESEQCDVVKRAQELLGAEVLQYCIVLLHQERFTGASRGIAGEMIHACGGRFHVTPDSVLQIFCQEGKTDTARQSFTTALFLSSPGPHAVLMVLNLEDEESEQCDVVKRAQELLGAEVLQYCIVLLHQERFTGASRGIPGEMIHACGGRFHMIRDSEPDPLVEEIDKMAAQLKASRDDVDVRILIVGIRGDSRFSAADILSGRKDGGQEDREIVKTPVITDEGRRMMLVTGPNLCEEDTARQSFTTALFLSSPGPHAVLMVLNLEDEESEQCEVVKRAQELLGAEVLQYCIVLLHQERFTGASRGIAGEMIHACGGRFHVIRDSEPDQTAALVEEIDKLVCLNGDGFYSVLTQELKTEETSEDVHEEIQLLSVIYDASGGAAGIIAWIFFVSLVVYNEGRNKILIFRAKFTALVLFIVYLRHVLSPDVAITLNLTLMTSLAIVFTIDPKPINEFNTSRDILNQLKNISSRDDDDVRILIVGIRGDSRFSAADILSGRKDGGQEDREIVKTLVITDEGRRMMLVTGPNLCEEDTARQSFTTALFLSSPGPHAVLMVLNLEDEESEQCDVVKRAQELLGAEVLQYCIVLLHQERFTGASRGIAGEMIHACGGRFHVIRDSEPDQTAALVEEIDKLVWLNASHDDDDMRILIVGIRGDSRFSAADILSGRKDGGQEDREIVKTPVITDEGRRMMLVTGPNLCEEDTARQSFTTALFLSSPGPHAVLMVLNLEDEESEQCDVVKRAQELLGAEVLQYCIVLLHQERFTGASRGIAGEMIHACGGRFHMIRDSKHDQTAALVEEIDKLVWINGAKFHSLNEKQQFEAERLELLKRLKEIETIFKENQVSSDTLGVVGWSLIISLIAVVLATERKVKMFIFQATLAALVTFMASIRNALRPRVAFALNLALCSTVAAVFIKDLPMRKLKNMGKIRTEFLFTVASHDDDVRILIVGIRGDSRFSAADILSGRKDGGQEDREIVKTPVITDEGRRMMLVTGPNLCEEDTARQSFTTALFLSSPGPHAVLMVLNLEDEESEQCDVVKRAQELLGAEVLQYCIVLLHQERFTGASRGIAGEMIHACGGRFHMIRDSEPDQTAALVEEIDKLVWINASHDDDVRILIVGIRGDSRFSAADILSGRKDGGQEDREIVKTPVITDEGRRMMLVTGPNLCEEDTARQSFTTALFLSSPGPHAVLMVLNLEDEESEQCDVVKRAQELLGAEVLQYCIVLLHQERFTGASRGIAGEMIHACGGRFHMIRDSEPDQTAALVAEIDKLVWLNGAKFYSLNEKQQFEAERLELLKRLKEIGGKFEENQVSSDTLGVVGWSLIISLIAVVLATERKGPFPVETLRSRGRFERKQKLSNHNIIEEVETVQKSMFRDSIFNRLTSQRLLWKLQFSSFFKLIRRCLIIQRNWVCLC